MTLAIVGMLCGGRVKDVGPSVRGLLLVWFQYML
jgi:hypothetical protein